MTLRAGFGKVLRPDRFFLLLAALIVVAIPLETFAQSRPSLATQDKREKKIFKKDDPWVLPSGDYWRTLESVDSHDEVSNGVRVQVVAIPNSLHYFISRACRDLGRAGYDDKSLARKLEGVYRKYKSQRDRMLFLVTISGDSRTSRAFYVSKPSSHIEIKSERKKASLHFVEEERKPRSAIWEIYQYVPNAPRKVGKKKLAMAQKHEMAISSRGIRSDLREPIALTVSGMLHAKSVKGKARGSEGLGVNERYNQVSMFRWRDQIMKPLTIRMFPGRWDVPDPPEELLDLIDRLRR